MSKFFVQLLLSVIVGVSAAFGFSPSFKSKLHVSLQQADTSLHETVNTVAENVSDVAANISSNSSIKTKAEVSAKSDEKARLNANSDLKAKIGNEDFLSGNSLPDVYLNSSSTNENVTHVEIHEPSLDVELKDKTKSALNLDLESGE